MSLDPKKKSELEEKLRGYTGVQAGEPMLSPDRVNEAMIRHWCVVMGDESPVYADAQAARESVHGGIVAPPAMLTTWVMPPYIPPWSLPGGEDQPAADLEVELHRLLGRYGYTGVVATNSEDEYRRYLRVGDRITATKTIVAISEEKATPLGNGYFVDVRRDFRDQDGELVGTQLFRVLKYRPVQQPQPTATAEAATPARPTRLQPPLGHDNAWWWEGIQRGELLIQKCSGCGELRHPPRPMCGRCQSLEWEGVRASGDGAVYSYTILHHPKVPGYEYPLIVGLVELAEGTRLVANIACQPEEIRIGMPVECRIESVDGRLALPWFHPVKG